MLIRPSHEGASRASLFPSLHPGSVTADIRRPGPWSLLALSAVEGIPGPCAGLAARSEEAPCPL